MGGHRRSSAFCILALALGLQACSRSAAGSGAGLPGGASPPSAPAPSQAENASPDAKAAPIRLSSTGPAVRAETDSGSPSKTQMGDKPSSEGKAKVQADISVPGASEEARYPHDFAIGSLEAGPVPDAAYRFALSAGKRLLSGNYEQLGPLPEEDARAVERILAELKPREFRLGGGRSGEDGSVSFLVRFLGDGESSAGEVYLNQDQGVWSLQDMLLDAAASDRSEDGGFRYDPLTYRKFL